MNRRELIMASAGAAVSTAISGGAAFAGEHNHKHINIKNLNEAVVAEAMHCIRTGEQCLKICIDVLASGDKSMADCAKSVIELSSVCGTLMKVAVHGSDSLKQVAAIAAEVCKSCEKQCLKHKEHSQCEDCAKACKQCAKVCEKYAA